MKPLVKICGIRSLEAAIAACEAGADFIGLNFVESSQRYITLDKAKEIITAVKGSVKAVGVFRNVGFEQINKIAGQLGLDYVQMHGNESPKYCLHVNAKVIKAFQLPFDFDLEKTMRSMRQYNADYYLIDRRIQGEGEMLSLEKAKEIAQEFPVLFAGGLTPENVSEVIAKVGPIGVDVASGIETDGREDCDKIQLFIKRGKGVKF